KLWPTLTTSPGLADKTCLANSID
ncbi:MAG: hypothetical protein RLZZ361_827, partial [Cyanobacteriota bacterium]